MTDALRPEARRCVWCRRMTRDWVVDVTDDGSGPQEETLCRDAEECMHTREDADAGQSRGAVPTA